MHQKCPFVAFTDVGDFEYHQISDILSYLRSPEQLHLIEQNSPQIKGADADLWQKFIAREVPKWAAKNYAPKNPLKWYEVYKRYKREQAEEIKRDEETLRQTMMGIKKARDDNLSKVVDLGSLPKLPRDRRMLANNGGVPLGRSGQRKEASGIMNFSQGSKTKMKDGQSVLTRARREAKEIAQMGKLSRPTHQLSIGRVARAPAAMLKEYRTANQPALKILSRKANFKAPEIENTIQEEREKRLRALTANSKVNGKKPQLVGSDDDSEGDDLFDDTPGTSRSKFSPKLQIPQPISPSKKTTDSKRPSDVISAMISKQSTASRYVTLSKTSKTSQSSSQTPLTSRPKPNSVNDLSVNKIPSSNATSIGAKPTMAKRRKEVDIFNRNASKRPRC
ncbi:hypothetical protein K3495_g7395 [Podosphaera aphanis]|nr:hypothetical protein K3495_g7395 [Podosphaera aphanis]